MKQEEIDKILNSDYDVRRNTAGNPNTPADALTELAKDSDSDVRSSAASNPSTPADALTELAKDSDSDVRSSAASNPSTPADALTELAKDSDSDVRSSAASNPSTPADALTELAKDSDSDVRSSAASNPSTPGYKDTREYIIGDNYIATQGTNHLWYKYKSEKPFYVCGCFIGNREQLIIRIMSLDMSENPHERLRILELLDKKFDETFNK